MSTITKVQVFVPANKEGRDDKPPYRFPRIRIIALLRCFLDDKNMRETITMVDEEWPRGDEHLRYIHGHAVGVVLTFITDDAGLGRVLRGVHKHDSFGYQIMGLEELSEKGVFASKGGA